VKTTNELKFLWQNWKIFRKTLAKNSTRALCFQKKLIQHHQTLFGIFEHSFSLSH